MPPAGGRPRRPPRPPGSRRSSGSCPAARSGWPSAGSCTAPGRTPIGGDVAARCGASAGPCSRSSRPVAARAHGEPRAVSTPPVSQSACGPGVTRSTTSPTGSAGPATISLVRAPTRTERRARHPRCSTRPRRTGSACRSSGCPCTTGRVEPAADRYPSSAVRSPERPRGRGHPSATCSRSVGPARADQGDRPRGCCRPGWGHAARTRDRPRRRPVADRGVGRGQRYAGSRAPATGTPDAGMPEPAEVLDRGLQPCGHHPSAVVTRPRTARCHRRPAAPAGSRCEGSKSSR